MEEEEIVETQEEIPQTSSSGFLLTEGEASDVLGQINTFLENPTVENDFVLDAIRKIKETCEKILEEE